MLMPCEDGVAFDALIAKLKSKRCKHHLLTATAVDSNDVEGDTSTDVSKGAIKRKRKLEKLQEKKAARREARKKQKLDRKLNRAIAAENPAETLASSKLNVSEDNTSHEEGASFEGVLDEDADVKQGSLSSIREKPPQSQGSEVLRTRCRRDEFAKKCERAPTIVIDCDWDDLHSAKDICSLVQQIMYSYGSNRRAEKPLNLVLCGISPVLDKELHRISGVDDWLCVRTSKKVQDLFPAQTLNPDQLTESEEGRSSKEGLSVPRLPSAQVVYLTADTDAVMEEEQLDQNKAYVIGGFVDHNQYKGLCKVKAEAFKFQPMKLPIKDHVKLAGTAILTVNQVFSILLRLNQTSSWASALKAVPRRKTLVTIKPSIREQEQSDTQNPQLRKLSVSQT